MHFSSTPKPKSSLQRASVTLSSIGEYLNALRLVAAVPQSALPPFCSLQLYFEPATKEDENRPIETSSQGGVLVFHIICKRLPQLLGFASTLTLGGGVLRQ